MCFISFYQDVHCPYCERPKTIKLSCPLGAGKNAAGTRRYLCQNKACESGMVEKIVEMAINGSGIRDTTRILNINKNTVIKTLKKQI
jgi:transposase-like protein